MRDKRKKQLFVCDCICDASTFLQQQSCRTCQNEQKLRKACKVPSPRRNFSGMTDELIKLVRTYRLTAGLAERLTLADEIFRLIEPDLRLFVFSTVAHDAAQDALQEVLKAIATNLQKFQGDEPKEFWAWSYRIARNKLNDHFRAKASDRMQPLPPEEMLQVIEASPQEASVTAQTRHDLEYAMNLLTAAKPECHELLWQHYVIGLDYAEIAAARDLTYDGTRMKIGRCLEEARSLVS